MDYLSNQDSVGLKSMFCKTIISTDNFDEEIQQALNFFDGAVTSHGSIVGGIGGRVTESGKTIMYDISPHIKDIETDSGKLYDIRFYCWLVNVDYPDKIGFSKLQIISSDGDECIIGDFYLVNPEYE